ncbi:acyl-CoA carboxylase subunit epsilon [Streptomyces sp. NPDC021356]|uniref:acyl-CoA carboxylase subunit epsilon n=1 Tax=Streptomyces sp. NPDC021356 TaxID=3154900 RepID=UPI0033FBF7A0
MGYSDHGEPSLRVERGRASDEELAALTVVLLALRADADADAVMEQDGRRTAGGPRRWRRPEAYKAPRSWQ